MPLFKSTGTTPSERYLANLCQHTFLSMWSYPNVFRDQGRRNGKGDGKELCDLLVVCGNDIIIFSDKSCIFPETCDLNLDWSRWFRRSIQKSAEQVYGAERWLRQYPDRIFLDRLCTHRFPFPIANPTTIKFHRIVIALNSADRCRKECGGNGSLQIVPKIIGNAHITPNRQDFQPFAIGQIDPVHGFVHVFDDLALDIVMRELDTITDFINYLINKEEIIYTGILSKATSEADLLAVYLTEYDDVRGTHGFQRPTDGIKLIVDDKRWNTLINHPQYIAKKNLNKPSYAWDSIIEEFTKHILGGTLVNDSETSIINNEMVFRIMASESRFSRRVLANSLYEKLTKTSKGEIGIRTILSKDHLETAYVLICMSNNGVDENQYRVYRRDYLTKYCFIVAWKHREYKRVIGIATEAGLSSERSYDTVYTEITEWTKEMDEDAEKIQKATKMFTRAQSYQIHDEEYPELEKITISTPFWKRPKIRPNSPCPCGSGKKFKKCCIYKGKIHK